ncbi:MAG TPA: 2-amino-4-hydroxy-6-hydroxymethyldihydropteridine diphosphokinase [Deltaproteobacteria bacterium]|nr:MAG: 2-amino-4-hydroxy-6-hydroxymethyldihydropteridine diphosphokinase [Deltaproteobacteria bacterium GWA2_55_82]OGQ62399.1 MAG: 2-amino-4-hydroxy-6-hydroxymethyldihydropteridine diphosphokinase [Deltaproteobacteria bacterium RIFCSPLOWO2_02_FULL_55_12]OIJ73311.1 MAG: 2-amino-4-hydroxy-6-hydroxymethyldihydropteridine diphosphokinase [Deltaproteobacteria bacterium GWC2_55_46]HBG45419.1 2-amino-4-hydroxy-6-hydroxymethyldihydropteridine diphosphokinase [Deltaproteobacteria bacterium]HCY10250.1 2
MEERIFIAIGTNLGDRAANVREALRIAEADGGLKVVKASSLYESEPWGVADQPMFVNAVVEARTNLSPKELLLFLKGIESRMGRRPSERWGPRLIDLDIVFYGERLLEGEGLVVPHPDAHERAFVMTPLAEIAPEFVHPVFKLTVRALADKLGGKGLRRIEG